MKKQTTAPMLYERMRWNGERPVCTHTAKYGIVWHTSDGLQATRAVSTLLRKRIAERIGNALLLTPSGHALTSYYAGAKSYRRATEKQTLRITIDEATTILALLPNGEQWDSVARQLQTIIEREDHGDR